MTFDDIQNHIENNFNASYDYPFDEEVRVYRVSNKIFALITSTEPLKMNLKCDPIYSLELRDIYKSVSSGYHMNKKHWNTIEVQNSDIDEDTIKELINHSYELVFNSLSKKVRESLG